MKKQIDIFKICEQCKIIASKHFTIRTVHIDFNLYEENSKSIRVHCNFWGNDGKLDGFMAEIENHELKFGSDLIYNRVEKAAIAKAIKLGIYQPQLLVF